ncbi:MAG: hypothetical protein ABI162_07350 [Luteolibacter sp.]
MKSQWGEETATHWHLMDTAIRYRRSCAAKRQHPPEWETPASFGRIRAENLK